jgi:hypothetical protein
MRVSEIIYTLPKKNNILELYRTLVMVNYSINTSASVSRNNGRIEATEMKTSMFSDISLHG